MMFRSTDLPDCFVIEPEPIDDDRGLFARTFAAEEFVARGLNPRVEQCSVSFNLRKGTLRGMHYQCPPHAEAKLVRCTAGKIYDVAVDLRSSSSTYRRWTATVLSSENRRSLYVPEGMAHGFVTLQAASEVAYQVSSPFVPQSSRGVRWDDEAVGIHWPDLGDLTISERDRAWPQLLT